MAPQQYAPLPRSSSGDSVESLHGDKLPCNLEKSLVSRKRRPFYVLCAFLAISVAFNALLFAKIHMRRCNEGAPSIARLEWNFPVPIPLDQRNIDDEMWEDPAYDSNQGFVALGHEYAKMEGAPTSQNWPWDPSKGIYVIHGFHSLHCVGVLRDAIKQFRDGVKQVYPLSHVTHCLNVLRQDIICYADDTPRYTGHLHANANETEGVPSGIGQQHMCRDWSQLREFALGHSACYHRSMHHYEPIRERYKHCPDGSTPWIGKEMSIPQK